MSDPIQAIRERHGKATKGPWAWEPIAEKSNEFAVGTAFDANGTQLSGRLPSGEWVEDVVIERRGLIGTNESGHANFADADFIAHAWEDIRTLLVEREALQAERQSLIKALRAIANDTRLSERSMRLIADDVIAGLLGKSDTALAAQPLPDETRKA